MNLSVIVPVYNSESSLITLIERLEPVLRQVSNEFEVIFINDGSTNRTREVINQLAAKYEWVRAISFMRNFGQHSAVLCGIRSASYPVIITMDDDLQHPPEEIPKLIKKLGEGWDVVYGTPEAQQHGIWRDLASELTKVVLSGAMGATTARNISAFRIFRTKLRDAFSMYYGPAVSVDALLTWGTTKFAAIPVRHDPRQAGVSNYTFGKLLIHAINVVTGFSTIPLRLATLNGCICLGLGFVLLVYVFGRFFIQGCDVPGFPFLASVVIIFSGAQLFSLGILGEYLARMYAKSMAKPTYVVETEQDNGSSQAFEEVQRRFESSDQLTSVR
ncbi:MAG TPA: glycosyltransferase family 2 protein [Drouetiella sp.]